MVEATYSLPPRPSYVLITLAQREARLAVKEQLRAQGLKPQYMRVSEINRAADIYLRANARELGSVVRLLIDLPQRIGGSQQKLRYFSTAHR